MRILLSVIVMTVFLSSFANAQEEKAQARELPQLQSYTLTLVEFRMKAPDGSSTTAENIAKDFEKLSASRSIASSETVRVSLLES